MLLHVKPIPTTRQMIGAIVRTVGDLLSRKPRTAFDSALQGLSAILPTTLCDMSYAEALEVKERLEIALCWAQVRLGEPE